MTDTPKFSDNFMAPISGASDMATMYEILLKVQLVANNAEIQLNSLTLQW